MAPCQLRGISHCTGSWQCVLNLSKESRNYLCQEDNFFVTDKMLTWLQSPTSWQKTNPREKRRNSNPVLLSWAESAQQWVPEMRTELGGQGQNRAGSKTKAAGLAPASRLSSLSKLHLQSVPTWANTQVTSRKRFPPKYSDDVHQGTEISLVSPPPFQKGK